ncbi:hypothetical protein [Streptococcus equi]|uniref:hypothetical protein n=1 Tax=Streptococcus equi TaxID=1336 RepID=UPI001E3591D6|nr:hypothetical protein [Streptococcus equi]MCD3370909.1 hypothetical protein [Streptococcus equi subsp. zooepidemicus]
MLHGLKHRLFKLAPDTGAGGGAEVTSETNAEAGQVEQTVSQQQADPVDTEAIKSQAINEVLRQLGVTSVEDAKANLASWNEYQEGQKTEFQKIQDSLTVANNSLLSVTLRLLAYKLSWQLLIWEYLRKTPLMSSLWLIAWSTKKQTSMQRLLLCLRNILISKEVMPM